MGQEEKEKKEKKKKKEEEEGSLEFVKIQPQTSSLSTSSSKLSRNMGECHWKIDKLLFHP